jgi:hypothetical protein
MATLIRGFSKFIEKNGSSGRLRPVDLMPARQESRDFCLLAGIPAWLTKA